MKPFILNSFRFFKRMEQNKLGKKEENNHSEKETKQNHFETTKQPPYYESFISKHNRNNGDFWDLSGGLIGI